MARSVKHYYKKKEQTLGKAIDDTASSLTGVASELIGGLLSAAADSVKESLFSKEDNEE